MLIQGERVKEGNIVIMPKNGFLGGFTIEGHARYAERGKDIVCASVSVLARSAVIGLDRYTKPSIEMRDGYLDLTIHEKSVEIEAIIHAVKETLLSIAMEYPEFVHIEEE